MCNAADAQSTGGEAVKGEEADRPEPMAVDGQAS